MRANNTTELVLTFQYLWSHDYTNLSKCDYYYYYYYYCIFICINNYNNNISLWVAVRLNYLIMRSYSSSRISSIFLSTGIDLNTTLQLQTL